MGWGVSRTPRPPLPPGKTRYPLYRRLSGTQGRSGLAENLVPTGIRSRTVQPVAQSLYRLSYPANSTLYLFANTVVAMRVVEVAYVQASVRCWLQPASANKAQANLSFRSGGIYAGGNVEFVVWSLFCCLIDGFIERDCAITYTCITSIRKLCGVSAPAL